jgi:uncharacterized membrane protein
VTYGGRDPGGLGLVGFRQGLGARQDEDAKQRSALHILEERVARGAIDREEFERRRESLSRH